MNNNEELMKYDEAIKILKKVEVFDFEAGDLLEYHSDIVRSALNFAIKELENRRWIPVSKRLPKVQERPSDNVYLVTEYSKKYDFKVTGKSYFDRLKGWSDTLVDFEVIAWMPWPEPYEGD